MSTDVERFVAVIRDSIETALLERGCEHDGGPGHELWTDGYINTDALARVVHAAVVEHLGPPF